MEFLAGEALDPNVLLRFLLALFIGALIGVERERKQERDPHQFGGLRTFILIAEAGAVAAWLGELLGTPLVFVGGIVGVSTFVGVAYFHQAAHSKDMPGLTSEFAGLVTYLLGGAAMLDGSGIAVALAIGTSALLTFKRDLHAVVRGMDRDDMVAVLKLCFATFIVLPFLPDRTVDPWDALNPYKLWLLVVLISALSLVGYVAVRWLGEHRGMALTGLFGGLVSSTAVTLTLARRSRSRAAVSEAIAVALVLAWSVMFVRVLVEVAVVEAPLLRQLTAPVVAMLVAGLIATAVLFRASTNGDDADDEGDVVLKNPFSLTAALQFGALFALVLLVVQVTRAQLSDQWLYGVAALAGATDVDAITLSVADQVDRGLPPSVATLAILIAAFANTATKLGMVAVLGTRALAWRAGLATLGIGAAGGVTLAAQVLLAGW